MQALRLHETHQPLQLETLEPRDPGTDQVLVRVEAAALNHRDCWITQGMYPGLQLPTTLGSDAAGTIERVGDDIDAALVGKQVVINPGLGWGDSVDAQTNEFEILGMPTDGTFATHVLVPAQQVYDRPTHLSWQESAALPLAGVTAYRALFSRGHLQAGQDVLVTGIGGGVATFALQFAVAARARVFVTSSSQEKIDCAKEAGAHGGFLYTEEDWHKAVIRDAGMMDVILDSAAGPSYGRLLDIAKPGGRIVNYGATAGPPEKLDMFKVFWKQLNLCGTTMGSPTDFSEMVDFVQTHQIKPVVDQVFPMADGNLAMQKMSEGRQRGKIVLQIA